jgi:GNAT superfamily N-acetyltransferase
MVSHGRDWFAQTEYSRSVTYDPHSVLATLRVLLEQKLLLVAEDGLDVIGFVGGTTVPMFMNLEHKIGVEMFWWVHPSYRRAGVGALLLDGIERAARAVGCKFWTMIVMQCMDPERAGAIYERAGYRWVERSYIKELS